MEEFNHIGPHEYSLKEGILCFAPRGVVLPAHSAQLVALFEQHGRSSQPLFCLFDLTGSPVPTPEARRVVVEFFRKAKPQICIATHGAPLHVRAMMALVAAAVRVIGGYHLRVTHFERREEAWEFLRKTFPG